MTSPAFPDLADEGSSKRSSVALPELTEETLGRDPYRLLAGWLTEALTVEDQATAMSLATVDAKGRPSARMVLLKGIDERGLVFFTNYESRKAVEMEGNPHVALVLHWQRSHRQVRLEGRAGRISHEESEAYWSRRPPSSRHAAWASRQSAPLDGRVTLERRMREAQSRHGQRPPLPPFWGGYRVAPERVEFWQGRPDRLHDRFIFEWGPDGWTVVRLYP